LEDHAYLRWLLSVLAVGGVCGGGWWLSRIQQDPEKI
jgi:hypothetical protein